MKATKAKKTTLPVDIYSKGTLRTVDLCLALGTELEALHLSKAERATVRACLKLARAFDEYRDEAYADEYHDAYEELTIIADSHCPPYCYYGSSEGDGACIGVWPDVNSVMEAVRDGDIARMDEDGFAPEGWQGLAVEASDHGNVTLYDVRGKKYTKVWAVV